MGQKNEMSVIFTHFKDSRERAVDAGSDEQHYGSYRMVRCACCGKASRLSREHGRADGAVPGLSVDFQDREAAREAVKPTPEEAAAIAGFETARVELARAREDLDALRAKVRQAKGRRGFDKMGAETVVGRDSDLLAEGAGLEAEAQRILSEAEAQHQAAGAAAQRAEAALRMRRAAWIAERARQRTVELEAPARAATEAQRQRAGKRLRELVGR